MWHGIRDLAAPEQPAEVRHATLTFTQALIVGQVRGWGWRRGSGYCPCLVQFEELGIMRAHFLHVVQSHALPEDTVQR